MKCSVRDSNGNLLGVLGIAAVTQMHELNERFTVAFASPAAISLTSPDCGCLSRVNNVVLTK